MKLLMDDIQRTFGPVHGLVHGAGVLADRKIVDQTDSQFDLVYDTKVKGLRHLYQAIDPDSLKFLILFSSSSARFGRSGQVAYAAANEALNKWAQQQSVRLSHCRVVSYNWGPWDGGMVKDSLRLVFEKEGLSLIPLDAGARLVVDEIRSDRSGPVEIVVLAEPVGTDQAREHTRDLTAQPRPPGRSSRPSFAARSTWIRCRCSGRTSLTGTPFYRWRSSWNGSLKGPSTATRVW